MYIYLNVWLTLCSKLCIIWSVANSIRPIFFCVFKNSHRDLTHIKMNSRQDMRVVYSSTGAVYAQYGIIHRNGYGYRQRKKIDYLLFINTTCSSNLDWFHLNSMAYSTNISSHSIDCKQQQKNTVIQYYFVLYAYQMSISKSI